ncbi:MAG: MBL fold metallo-hydrolase [Proteobacteria bacterium]|nr:MBL fold metallo-hydrolase [Pseudomonadota bacterium]
MTFQVQILGVGDFFTEVHNFSSFVINADGRFTLVDCPDGLPRIIKEMNRVADIGVRPDKLNHIMVTHLHGDHSNGLEGMAYYKKFLQGGKKPVVYSIREVLKDLWPGKLKSAMKSLYAGSSERIGTLSVRELLKECERAKLEDYFSVFPLEFNKANRVNGLDVEVRSVRHHIPTFGFRATYRGKALGYSSDTFFDPSLIDFLKDCDMIIHECDFQNKSPHKGIHTGYNDLVRLPESIKKKIFLIHYPDTASDEDSELKLLKEGHVYDLT